MRRKLFLQTRFSIISGSLPRMMKPQKEGGVFVTHALKLHLPKKGEKKSHLTSPLAFTLLLDKWRGCGQTLQRDWRVSEESPNCAVITKRRCLRHSRPDPPSSSKQAFMITPSGHLHTSCHYHSHSTHEAELCLRNGRRRW